MLEAQDKMSKELDSVSGKLNKMSKNAKKTSKTMIDQNKRASKSFSNLRNTVIGAFVVTHAARFTKEIMNLSTNLDLMDKKADTVL